MIDKKIFRFLHYCFLITFFILPDIVSSAFAQDQRTRVIVISDGEIDDECSIVRFLLYANDFDVEAIITQVLNTIGRGTNGLAMTGLIPIWMPMSMYIPT